MSSEIHRPWVWRTLGASVVLLLLTVVYVVVVDPFMHYHAPWFGYQMVSWKEAYLNPGLVRHLDYDAVVIGGSYVQNTKVTTVDEVFGVNAVKLTNAGGTPANLGRLLSLAFDSGKTIKTALVAIPVTKFASADVTKLRSELPEYLYDKNPFNDIAYVFNREVLVSSAVAAVDSFVGKTKARTEKEWLDKAYSWWDRYKKRNGKAYILAHYTPRAPRAEKPADAYVANARAQFDTQLRPLIEAHPETTFRFFFPPFSRLLWRDIQDAGTLRAHLEIKRWLTGQLLGYPNVEVHDFMRLEQFMSDLNNYKDRTHFLPPVTEYITRALATGEHRLTAAPTDSDLESFEDFVRSYEDPDIPRASSDSDKTPSPDDDVGQDLF